MNADFISSSIAMGSLLPEKGTAPSALMTVLYTGKALVGPGLRGATRRSGRAARLRGVVDVLDADHRGQRGLLVVDRGEGERRAVPGEVRRAHHRVHDVTRAA